MIGYHDEKKAYRLWDPTNRRIEISHDVTFNESIILKSPTIVNPENQEYIIKEIIGECEIDEKRQYLVKWLGYDDDDNTWEPIEQLIDTEALQIWQDRMSEANLIESTDDPMTYKEAISLPDAKLWEEAINQELKLLKNNDTWTIVPEVPVGRKPIGCRWVFKKKLNTDGSVARYKARLVAKGYSQQQGIDYDETFAPVAKFTSIRALLSIGATLNLEIHQMDVKTAFLNGDLDEEIYMMVPEGIDQSELSPRAVCKLNRSLYGLKQSPRIWNQKIDNYLSQSNFTKLQSDHSIYLRRRQEDQSLIIITIYVDDLLILANSMETMNKFKVELSNAFDMMDCGEIKYFLGIQVMHDRKTHIITIDQSHFANQIITRFNMTDAKPISTPLDLSIQLKAEGEKSTDQNLFRQIIGSIMYLMIRTRSDLAPAVSIISQFSANPM